MSNTLNIIGQEIITEDTERQDRIAKRLYGEVSGPVERLLEANPGLAEKIRPTGGLVPFGTVLDLPEAEEPKDAEFTRPWE